MKGPRDIMVIRRSALGDILHVLPALAALKSALPDSRIYLLVKERFRLLAQLAPFLEGVWTSPEFPVDAVIDCQGLMRTAWTARRTRAPLIAGYSWKDVREKPAALLYNRRVSVSDAHIIDRHAALLSGALETVVRVDKQFRADFLIVEDPGLESFLSGIPAPRVLVHPTSSQRGKHLSFADWLPVLLNLGRRGFKVLLSHGPGEEEFIAPWVEAFPKAVVVPVLPVERLASVLAGCRLMIGSDTGITHLADQLGIPVLSWFSLWPPERNGPYFSPNLVFYRRRPDPCEADRWIDSILS